MLRPFMFAIILGAGSAMPAFASCEDPQNQLEMNQCAGDAYAAADQELNAVYKQLIGSIDETYEPALRAAQRAWVPFRDAECEFESMGWEGGSGRPMIQAACLKRVTEERTKLLKQMLDCEPESAEGNMECPRKK